MSVKNIKYITDKWGRLFKTMPNVEENMLSLRKQTDDNNQFLDGEKYKADDFTPVQTVKATVATDIGSGKDITYTAVTSGVIGNAISVIYRISPIIEPNDQIIIKQPNGQAAVPRLTITGTGTSQDLAVTVTDDLVIQLETDGDDAIQTTIAELVAFLNADEDFVEAGFVATVHGDIEDPDVVVTAFSVAYFTSTASIDVIAGKVYVTFATSTSTITGIAVNTLAASINADDAAKLLVLADAGDNTTANNTLGSWDLEGGVDGTVDVKGKLAIDATHLHVNKAASTLAASNWEKIPYNAETRLEVLEDDKYKFDEGTPVDAVSAEITTDLAATNDVVFTAKTKGVAGNSIKASYQLLPKIMVDDGSDDLFEIELPADEVDGTTIPALTITQAATEAAFSIDVLTKAAITITLEADENNDPVPITVKELKTALETHEDWATTGYTFKTEADMDDETVPAVAATDMDSTEAIATSGNDIIITLGTTSGTIDSDVASIIALIGEENALVTAAAKDGTDDQAIDDVGEWTLIGGVNGTVAVKGQRFFDDDFQYIAIADSTISDSNFVRTLFNPKFAEITIDDNSTATAIDVAGKPHAVVNTMTERFAQGFTTKQGKRTALENIEGGSTPGVAVEATAHGCAVGDIVTITGTTNYNNAYIVLAVTDANNLTLDATVDEAAQASTGAISLGSQIIATGSWGHKRVTFTISASSAANNKTFMFQLLIWKEATGQLIACDKCKTISMTQNASELFNAASSIIINWEEGDRICLAVTGITDATDLTIAEADLCVI